MKMCRYCTAMRATLRGRRDLSSEVRNGWRGCHYSFVLGPFFPPLTFPLCISSLQAPPHSVRCRMAPLLRRWTSREGNPMSHRCLTESSPVEPGVPFS